MCCVRRGPNGSGKSTTIKLIAGLSLPTRGSITVNNSCAHKNRYSHLKNIGMVMGQRDRLFWDLPVIDSFKFHCLAYDMPSATHISRIETISKRFDIKGIINKTVRELSLGQRVRCNLAMNLLHQPRVLLLDEPTIGLDFRAKSNFRDCIKEAVNDYGVTVLLTSHDLNDITSICKKIALIDKGSLVYYGTMEELPQRFNLYSYIELKSDEIANTINAIRSIPEVISIKSHKEATRVLFDANKVPSDKLISKIFNLVSLSQFKIKQLSLEEVLDYAYED